MKHKIDFRVYYEDTDAGGIMYHASFIRFCERGRTEFLRHLGLSHAVLFDDHETGFVVRHMECDYFKPAKLEDMLTVETGIKELKNSSFVMEQSIFCQDLMLFSMTVTIVCVGGNRKPMRVPDMVREKFKEFV